MRFLSQRAAICWLAMASVASAQPVLLTAPTSLHPGDTSITSTGGGPAVPLATADITVRGTTLTVNGRFAIRSLTLESNAILTHDTGAVFDYSGNGTDVVNGLCLAVRANPNGGTLSVDSTSSIDVTGRGYAADSGPGKGTTRPANYGGGGGHGGRGGKSLTTDAGGKTYGSFESPTTFGSGGGSYGAFPAGAGGGTVRLDVDGALLVNGSIRANGAIGTDSRTAGGAGGSVWLKASSLQGTGSIAACGATSELGGGGGGGRVALEYASSSFAGPVDAFGDRSTRGEHGGAGSIFRSAAGAPPTLTFDNGGRLYGAIEEFASPFSFRGSFALLRGARISHASGSEAGLDIRIDGDMTIDSTSAIDVRGRGYPGGTGPGAGTTNGSSNSGAGHGGPGGLVPYPLARGGGTYGSVMTPTTLGSGGGSPSAGYSAGATGGGATHLQVGGMLTLDGLLAADAAASAAGGGSGGSVWIVATRLTGKGSISACGGSAGSTTCASGGGGRIALDCSLNTFTGVVSAWGGGSQFDSNPQPGAAGTILRKSSGAKPKLTIDNGGRIHAARSTLPLRWYFSGDVELLRAAKLGHEPGFPDGLQFSISDNLTIDDTSSIDLTGAGYPADSGPGKGLSDGSNPAGGGGHAGLGGKGSGVGGLTGGQTYGDAAAPEFLGSGGGFYGSLRTGYAGGGRAHVQVGGVLTNNGSIKADGASCVLATLGSGGGSGGSLWLQASSLAGAGLISAYGGGATLGGGGGGGRIAIDVCNNAFDLANVRTSGGMSASGQPGGAGTMIVRPGGLSVVEQPSDQYGCARGMASFDFIVLGAATYQWYRGGVLLTDGPTSTGATLAGTQTSKLTLTDVRDSDRGEYSCRVVGTCGSTVSRDATLATCGADFRCDGFLTFEDFDAFVNAFEAGAASADFNADGFLTFEDFDAFVSLFEAGC